MRNGAGTRGGVGCALVALLLAVPGLAQSASPSFTITPELVARLGEEAKSLLRAELRVELAGVEVRAATASEIEDSLVSENSQLLGRLSGDASLGERQARDFAGGMVPALFAKYAFAGDDVLVQVATFAKLAEVTGIDELNGESALRAVILHELVHAADDERYDIGALFARCATSDAVRATNALIEGHAQLVARELAPRFACAEGFATYTRSITAPPKRLAESGAGAQMLVRTLTGFLSTSYIDGEAFFVALRAEGGEEAVKHAFREPPADVALIVRPAWYLHPEQRPHVAFELEPALDAFVTDSDTDGWAAQRLSVSAADMRNSFAPLPVEEIDALAVTMRQNRVQSLTNRSTGAQLVLGVFEFGTPAEAEAYLTAYERMQRQRDETMKTGAIRILSAEYERLGPPDPSGLRYEKRVSAGLIFDMTGLCVVRGSLGVEMMSSRLADWDGDRLLETAVKALDDALSHPRAAEATSEAR